MIRALGLMDLNRRVNQDTALYEKALKLQRKHVTLGDALATVMEQLPASWLQPAHEFLPRESFRVLRTLATYGSVAEFISNGLI